MIQYCVLSLSLTQSLHINSLHPFLGLALLSFFHCTLMDNAPSRIFTPSCLSVSTRLPLPPQLNCAFCPMFLCYYQGGKRYLQLYLLARCTFFPSRAFSSTLRLSVGHRFRAAFSVSTSHSTKEGNPFSHFFSDRADCSRGSSPIGYVHPYSASVFHMSKLIEG
jgi:hypothetical protein